MIELHRESLPARRSPHQPLTLIASRFLAPAVAATILAGLLLILDPCSVTNAADSPKPPPSAPNTLEPLRLQLPVATAKGTPADLPAGPNIEPLSDKPPPPLLVPKGVTNVALGKPVTSSVAPFAGELSQITDGKKEASDNDAVEFKKGSQWVQVDLGHPYRIYAIALWHDHRYIQAIHSVIVQLSDDPDFKTGVTSLFNNDAANSSGLGLGTDREYFETKYGRVIDGKATKARYVRCHRKGSTLGALNCWQEVEVYATPDN